ncbi:unnamed protein product [Prunus armeniaca]
MSQEIMEFCKKEIHELLQKKIIRKSKSPWYCPAFYVQKNAELERGVPRLVINYKPLNSVLEWIRYPIPNKRDLINRLGKAVVYSKFDMKSGFWQIQIHESDRYKTAFVTPFGHYEWNVMPFGLKNAPSEFQNIMNEIFNPYSHFSIVYIDDVLIFSESIEQHWKHLHKFLQIVKQNGLVVSAKKIKLFQTNIRFLGFNIHQSQISPIDRVVQFADKFPDQILDKSQLQRLQSNPPPWSNTHTEIVKQIKAHVKTLPCLGIPSVDSFKIVETDASDKVYGGILKQRACPNSPEQIVRCSMAPKKDKQKESTSQSKPSQSPSQSLRILPSSMSQNKPEIPKQVVPYPGYPPISVATPISVANKFSALGSTIGQISPSYQSTLIFSYDPFSVDPSVGPSVTFKKSSPYMPKSTSHLFVLEPIYDIHSDPVEIAKHYFPPGFHYMPPSPYKSLKYYRDILLETQSVEIKPIRDRDHPEIILYHSLYIHKIISQESFSSHPYELKTLQSKLQYNYSDYIEAWYSIFLHQSEDFSHSWFINFDNKFKSPLPFWFLHWWEKHGPVDEILPISVHELIRHYTKKVKFSKVDLFFPKQLLFIARYKVPWILKWSYKVARDTTRVLARQFSVKWWDKFEVDRIAKYVYNDLPQEPIPHPISPTGSTRSSLSVEGKSKTELQEIARQLIIQASQMDDDEDNDSPSSSSCQPMQSPAKKKFWYKDSQDPYDAYDLNSD